MKERILHWQFVAAGKGIRIRYQFLADVDIFSTFSVSCGAALSGLRIPPIAEALDGTAIGIQPMLRVLPRKGQGYDKETKAEVLFSKMNKPQLIRRASLTEQQGCGSSPYIDFTIPFRAQGRLKFRVVCDPNHYKVNSQVHKHPTRYSRDTAGPVIKQIPCA